MFTFIDYIVHHLEPLSKRDGQLKNMKNNQTNKYIYKKSMWGPSPEVNVHKSLKPVFWDWPQQTSGISRSNDSAGCWFHAQGWIRRSMYCQTSPQATDVSKIRRRLLRGKSYHTLAISYNVKSHLKNVRFLLPGRNKSMTWGFGDIGMPNAWHTKYHKTLVSSLPLN